MAGKSVGSRCVQMVSKTKQNEAKPPIEIGVYHLHGLLFNLGSVSCKRSFSALRRLKLWTRSLMTEERLRGLAMMLIHRRINNAKGYL